MSLGAFDDLKLKAQSVEVLFQASPDITPSGRPGIAFFRLAAISYKYRRDTPSSFTKNAIDFPSGESRNSSTSHFPSMFRNSQRLVSKLIYAIRVTSDLRLVLT